MLSHPPRHFLGTRCLMTGAILLVMISGYLPGSMAQGLTAGPPVKPPELVGTNQKSFEIPFSPGQAADSVVQVILYVSQDSGRTWQQHSVRPPAGSGFPFTATAEGEYWFAIQTVNRDGQRLPPANQLRPELRIAIDTSQPELEFDVRPDAAGRVVATIKASDRWISPRSLTIEYQAANANGPWTQVPAQSTRVPRGGVYFDELAWWPQNSGRDLVIRASIQDVAGNSVTVTRQMTLPLVAAGSNPATAAPVPNATGPPDPSSPAGLPSGPAGAPETRILTHYQQSRLPVALEHLYGSSGDPDPAGQRQASRPGNDQTDPGWKPPPGSGNVPLAARPSPVPQPPRAPNRLAQNTIDGDDLVPSAAEPDQSARQWQSRASDSQNHPQQVTQSTTASWQPRADQPDAVTATSATIRVAHQRSGIPAPSPQEPAGRIPPGPPPVSSPTVWPAQASPRPSPATDPVPDAGNPGRINAVWSASTTGAVERPAPQVPAVMASGPQFEALRKMARPSNSRQFQLEYDIDAIGPEGAKQVELWISADGGNSWRRHTTDDDLRSPVDVRVDNEGIFGFRIRVISNEGLAREFPAAAIRPTCGSMWIPPCRRQPLRRPPTAPPAKPANWSFSGGPATKTWRSAPFV